MIIRVPRIPRPGETILGGAFSMAAGGKGANQAVAAARAGGRVTLRRPGRRRPLRPAGPRGLRAATASTRGSSSRRPARPRASP
ncbi:MAG: PfkB family carbohydrate kinase [Candidatus Moduliflexus flocculans]|nr:PfkB family carbohydrate kinase [Candidatus Moduliflexus flocculans]